MKIYLRFGLVPLMVMGLCVRDGFARTIHVDGASGSDGNGGTGWGDAYATVTQALAQAVSSDDIWVAQGTYYPGSGRSDSFPLKDGVDIYGGFANGDAWGARDWTTKIVTLSGEVQQNADNTDNAYHVVSAVSVSNLAVDGVAIVAGYANGAEPADRGGGLYCSNAVITVRNGSLEGNLADLGGAIYNGRYSALTTQDSTFTNNTAESSGGGIYNWGLFNNAANSTCTLERCTFVANVAHGAYSTRGGGAVFNTQCPVTITDCTFRGNLARDLGGALWGFGNSCRVTIDGCIFTENAVTNTPGSDRHGGAARLSSIGPATIRNCIFNRNYSTYYAAALSFSSTDGRIENCTFAANVCKYPGANPAIRAEGAETIVSNCTFAANDSFNGTVYFVNDATVVDCVFSSNKGGGSEAALVLNAAGDTLTVRNSVFCGHYANYYGTLHNMAGTLNLQNCLVAGNLVNSAAYFAGGPVMNRAALVVENCTLANNRANGYGGAIRSGFTGAANACAVTNSVLWNNSAGVNGDAIYGTNGAITASYNDVDGGLTPPAVVTDGGSLTDAGGNVDVNPLFAPVLTGQWTANSVYHTNLAQTVLTNSSANWQSGELVGQLLNPDTNSVVYQYYVYTNSAKSITVWGDASEGASGEAYAIHDYHLQSEVGRWTPVGWTKDGANSPCIDAGHPDSDYANEPGINGGQINLGAYGNTAQASQSPPVGTVVIVQ